MNSPFIVYTRPYWSLLFHLSMTQAHFQNGDYIIRQGAVGDTFYIIVSGQVRTAYSVDIRLRYTDVGRNANGAMQMAQRNAMTNPNPNRNHNPDPNPNPYPNLLTRHLRCAICVAPFALRRLHCAEYRKPDVACCSMQILEIMSLLSV